MSNGGGVTSELRPEVATPLLQLLQPVAEENEFIFPVPRQIGAPSSEAEIVVINVPGGFDDPFPGFDRTPFVGDGVPEGNDVVGFSEDGIVNAGASAVCMVAGQACQDPEVNGRRCELPRTVRADPGFGGSEKGEDPVRCGREPPARCFRRDLRFGGPLKT